MYTENNIAIVVNGQLRSFHVNIADNYVIKPDFTKVRGIRFIKGDGTMGLIQYWTDDAIDNAIQAASKISELELDARNTFCIYKESDIVRHRTFGVGKILYITGKGDNQRLVVLFEDGSKKTLVKKYAPLNILLN